jgi:phage portal protein BeeE
MGMIDRVRSYFDPIADLPKRDIWPFVNFGGTTYPLTLNQTLIGNRETPAPGYSGLVQWAYQANPVVFACHQVRQSLFSEARFQFRQVRNGRPGDLFGTAALRVLEQPWPNGTTGDLLAHMIQDADLAGNAFVTRTGDRLARLRPDWVTIVMGSERDPDVGAWDPESEVLGYVYTPGGPGSGRAPVFLDRSVVAHFAPTPDPLSPYRGMSWLTPVLREIGADVAMTDHKSAFLEHGATPNMVVSLDPAITTAQFNAWKDAFDAGHTGVQNAYKTLFLGGGAKVEVVGKDLQQLDFKQVQGAGETRIAAAAGVPPVIVGLSEGLQAATYSNYSQARRRFADGTMRPLWRNVSASLATVVAVPGGAELWVDDRDIAFLRDDAKDVSEIQSTDAQAIKTLVDSGFDPASVVDAITAGDLERLKHTGLYSVQLQPPQPEGPPEPEPGAIPEALVPFVKAVEKDDEDEEEKEAPAAAAGRAMVQSIAELRSWMERRESPPPPVTNVYLPEQAAPVTNVTVEPATVTITTPDVTVEAPIVNVAPAEVTVNVEPTPVTNVIEPTPVTVTNEVSVEPTPVTITNELPDEPARTVIDRDPETGAIIGAHEEAG